MSLYIGTKKISDLNIGISAGGVKTQSKEVTPSSSDIIVSPDAGFTSLSQVTVKGDSDLKSSNIKAGINIFGISGNYAGEEIKLQNKSTSPTETLQEIVPDSNFNGLSKVTIAPIDSSYVGTAVPRVSETTIVPSANNQIAAESGSYLIGDIIISGDDDLKAENIKDGVNIFGVAGIYKASSGPSQEFKTQEKSATPTKSTQNIIPDTGFDGLTKVTINPIPSEYITTTDATASVQDIKLNRTAYVNGQKVVGQMPVNGDVSNTITTQNGEVTIPEGYTSGGTIKAEIEATTLTNSIINGSSFQEATKDYGWRSTVTIPEGYHNAVTLTKDFSSMLPEPETEGAAEQVLVGYDLYDHDGKLINGSMPNNGSVTASLNQTTTEYTIPEGYHDGTGKVSHSTVDIPNPTISVNATGLITASGSWTRGYTTDNSYSNTKQLTTKAGTTITPTESEQTAIAAGTYATGDIKIGAISSTYVGSGITTRNDSGNTTLNGTTTSKSFAAGYYPNAHGATHTTVNIPDPTISVNTSTGLITASGSWTAGFTTDTSYSKTQQLTTQAAKTVTPTKSSQTAVAAQRYTTGAVTVAAIPAEYITTTDATATQSDIISGQTAYVNGSKVTGNLVVQRYYTGSSAPSSTLGNDGDIYLRS